MSHPFVHPFIVGERYEDRRGEYTVAAIEGGRVRIEYDDGTKTEGNLETKARIYKNILNDRKNLHPYQSKGYFYFLGFLATHADFQAEVPPQSGASFEENYFILTGRRPTLHSEGYYPIQIETTWDKWAPELRIYFREPTAKFDLPPGVEIVGGHEAGVLRLNNNKFWRQLVKVGFRLGRVHDVSKIRESVPYSGRADFDAGMGSATK